MNLVTDLTKEPIVLLIAFAIIVGSMYAVNVLLVVPKNNNMCNWRCMAANASLAEVTKERNETGLFTNCYCKSDYNKTLFRVEGFQR